MPLVVIFAWVYEITPEGLKPTVEVSHDRYIRKPTGRRLDRAIIAVLAVALAYFVVDEFWISRPSATQTAEAAGLYFIKVDPLLKNLEADPRYKAFLRKMNLPE